MHSESSIGQVRANLIGGIACVHSTIHIADIGNSQSSKIVCIIPIPIDLILGGVHVVHGADDLWSGSSGISEGPVDFMRWDGESTTGEHSTAAIVDGKLVLRRSGYHRGA